MIVFLNGRFLPEEQAVVSVFDRGFLYGDGLFEAVRVCRGAPFRWPEHFQRLEHGARLLHLRLPQAEKQLRSHIDELVRLNQMPDAMLRLNVSRGIGPRGYSPRGAEEPTLALSLHPLPTINPDQPPRWRAITSSLRLPANEALAQAKTCNKLTQVLARAEADAAGVEEALLVNTRGHLAEASSGNFFWIQDGVVYTPELAAGVLPGVTRNLVLELCGNLNIPTQEAELALPDIPQVDGAFLSLTSLGVVELIELDGQMVRQSRLVAVIQQACHAAMLA